MIVDKTDPKSYTVQTKLLLCQLIYDVIISTPKKFSTDHVLALFKKHPLINDAELRLTTGQLERLVGKIMVENKLMAEEELPAEFVEYKKKVPQVIEACNIYFIQRTQDLEAEIGENQKTFRAMVAKQ